MAGSGRNSEREAKVQIELAGFIRCDVFFQKSMLFLCAGCNADAQGKAGCRGCAGFVIAGSPMDSFDMYSLFREIGRLAGDAKCFCPMVFGKRFFGRSLFGEEMERIVVGAGRLRMKWKNRECPFPISVNPSHDHACIGQKGLLEAIAFCIGCLCQEKRGSSLFANGQMDVG
ncbi:hypothetical protein [Akkermansia sp.]|uniref:hypothetical protein n=1 Tax=Akkermansia sp. TaxID=1872421 RepID=UPI003AB8D723